jgi:hypothetical protein
MSLLREDALVTGIIDNEFYLVATSQKYSEDLFVLTYKDGVIRFDQGWYQNDNILTLRFSRYGMDSDKKGYISTYVDGVQLILKFSFEEDTLVISPVNIQDIDEDCIIDLRDTVMPTDGNGVYSWVPLTFGHPDGKVNINAMSSISKRNGFAISSFGVNLTFSGFVSPVPLSWFSKGGDRIVDDVLIHNFCFRLNKLDGYNYQCTLYDTEGTEGITDFGDGYKTDFTPFYTSSSCGEKWDKSHKNTFNQDITLDEYIGYGEPSLENEICASINDGFKSVQYPVLIIKRANETIEEDVTIVEQYISDNRNDILNFIGERIFVLFQNICEYINSDGRCRQNICSQCTEKNCPESFRDCPGGCGPPGTGGAPMWAIWVISILAFAFIVAVVSGIICLIYYNRESREVERLRTVSLRGRGS